MGRHALAVALQLTHWATALGDRAGRPRRVVLCLLDDGDSYALAVDQKQGNLLIRTTNELVCIGPG